MTVFADIGIPPDLFHAWVTPAEGYCMPDHKIMAKFLNKTQSQTQLG